jgi:hypothetical protein
METEKTQWQQEQSGFPQTSLHLVLAFKSVVRAQCCAVTGRPYDTLAVEFWINVYCSSRINPQQLTNCL